jgi:hypothetical protein
MQERYHDMRLYLDSFRDLPEGGDWVIARSYTDAVDWVKTHQFPDFISFGPIITVNDTNSCVDFARWLVDFDQNKGDSFIHRMPYDFHYTIHASRDDYKAQIRHIMNKYLFYKHNNVWLDYNGIKCPTLPLVAV